MMIMIIIMICIVDICVCVCVCVCTVTTEKRKCLYCIDLFDHLLSVFVFRQRFPSAPPTTPLHAAASLGNDVAVAWLLQQDGILVDGPEPVCVKCHHFFNYKNNATNSIFCPTMQNKSTPLHMAVEAKFLTCAQLLIEKKANVNTSDKVR